MMRRNWTREETLVAFNLYCRTSFGRLTAGNPEIIKVAAALGRTPDAVAMKCCNLAAFDQAHQARGIRGLRNSSRLDAQLWDEFHQDPESIGFDAELAYARVMSTEPRTAETIEWEDVQGLDRAIVTKVRVNQQFFRSMVLTGYCSRCAICELPLAELLVASHIVPWSLDRSQRMNPRNGICLCTLHDKAFDKGLVAVSSDYLVSVHPTVSKHRHLPIVADALLRFDGGRLLLPERWHPDPALLQRHWELFGSRLS